MGNLKKQVMNFFKQESAPTFFEYGLLIILIAMVVVVAAVTFGAAVREMFSGVASWN